MSGSKRKEVITFSDYDSRGARRVEAIVRTFTMIVTIAMMTLVLFLLAYLFVRGVGSINWQFLSDIPRDRMTGGGIWPAIAGTLWLIALVSAFALPIGIATGIYLAEIAKPSRPVRVLRVAIANMAGVPSVVYGLFGFAAFSLALGFGKSLLAMGLTLACVTLPVVITATEEALKQIPNEQRQAAMALGCTRARTLGKVILPTALPGILTGAILGLSRAAGETAPILFTGVAFFAPVATDVMQPSMALPYHLYIMATQPTTPAPHIVWGTALVLTGMLSITNAAIATWRSAKRRKLQW
ncbi:MAG: phosphate ABC transporter permease PstA [Coriobacteriia bacterium]|nr:phosphate ABC transporter permease PstA [Coriobacteriia bacterium]MCL2537070.1 phosphate ABC transporter permease PstA [Coriobacteriia bacterium]